MKVVGGLNSGRLLKVLKDGLTKEDMYQPNLKCLVGRKVSVTISPRLPPILALYLYRIWLSLEYLYQYMKIPLIK